MSWLRDHFHNFVFPAFLAAEKRSSEIGKPFDVRPSPNAPAKLPSELRKLWTLCQEHNVPWEYDIREVNSHGGNSKYREKAKVDHNVLNCSLDSAMAAMRAEKCSKLFLGGRDVWAFAVMCEKRRIPYMFVPELSRYVASRPEVRPFLEERGFTGDELFLDTGFAGSIPRSLAAHFPGRQFKFRLMSQTEQFKFQEGGIYDSDKPPHRVSKKERWKRFPNQLFPNRKKAREEALFQEYVAKLWKTGTFSEPMVGAPIGQVNAVFKEWLHRPNIWRYDDAKHRCLCMTDGNEAIAVGIQDLKMAPGFHEWWKSLPKGPVWVPKDHKPGEIVQYLADRRSIQRAALLTSQLWRGIPYWRTMTVDKPKIFVGNVGDAVLNTTGINNFQIMDNSTSTITYTSNFTSANSAVNPVYVQKNLASAGFTIVQGVDANTGLPMINIEKVQLDLFKDIPAKQASLPLANVVEAAPSQMELLANKYMKAEAVDLAMKMELLPELKHPEMTAPSTGPCGCGPEEACADCPGDKVMSADTWETLQEWAP